MAIPNSGIYLEQQALAQQAYEAATAQLNAKQTSLYNQFGLRMNNGAVEVDPHNQFGQYQQMRRGQAMELEDVEDRTLARGIRGGLGGQLLNPTRYAHGLQNLGLSNSFLDAFKGIQADKQNALFAKNRAMWESERDQAMRSIDEEDFTPAAPPGTQAPRSNPAAKTGRSPIVNQRQMELAAIAAGRPKPFNYSYARRVVR